MAKNASPTRQKEGRPSLQVYEKGGVREVKRPAAEKPPNTRIVRRISLDLPEKAADQLAWLEAETGAMSVAEVIRDALKLYYGMVTEVKSGSSINVTGANGENKELKIFL